nr:MAG TPA: hypothetical protein [Caudoviricetes sp.]
MKLRFSIYLILLMSTSHSWMVNGWGAERN